MLTDSSFPIDIRVRQEALLLVEHGHEVSVVAIKYGNQPFYENLGKIKVYRLPKLEVFGRGKQSKVDSSNGIQRLWILAKGIFGYGVEHLYLTVGCLVLSLLALVRTGFSVLHMHNPPDTLFVIGLFYKLCGKKMVFDHHDLAPDLFLAKYGQRLNLVYRVLLVLEKLSCKTAEVIIATNESYKEIEVNRCKVSQEKIFVVRNGPDLNELKRVEPVDWVRNRARTILCFLGAINVQDGVDNLLRVLSVIVQRWNYRDVCLLVVGDGDYLHRIKEIVVELDVSGYVILTGHVSDRKAICRYLSSADIFLDGASLSFLNDNSTFIKHMEYMAFGRPVVSFALKESMFSLGEAGVFVKPNDVEKMAKEIIALANDKNRQEELGEKALRRAKQLSWDRVSIGLVQAYDRLGQISGL